MPQRLMEQHSAGTLDRLQIIGNQIYCAIRGHKPFGIAGVVTLQGATDSWVFYVANRLHHLYVGWPFPPPSNLLGYLLYILNTRYGLRLSLRLTVFCYFRLFYVDASFADFTLLGSGLLAFHLA